MRTAALSISGEYRNFHATFPSFVHQLIKPSPGHLFDLFLGAGQSPPPGMLETLRMVPRVREVTFVQTALSSAPCETKSSTQRSPQYSFYQAMGKLMTNWAVLERRAAFDIYIATRFDLTFAKPIVLDSLDVSRTLYVANKEFVPRSDLHRWYDLDTCIPDFIAIADKRRIGIWMTRQRMFAEVWCVHGDRPLNRSLGVEPAHSLSQSPEAFLYRYLHAHGLHVGQVDRHGSPSDDIQLLPNENFIKLSLWGTRHDPRLVERAARAWREIAKAQAAKSTKASGAIANSLANSSHAPRWMETPVVVVTSNRTAGARLE